MQQGSAETECTDALLKRHRPAMIQTEDDIFSGRSVESTQKDLSQKATQATVGESSSGSYQQFQHNQSESIEYDEGTLDMSAMGSHGPQGTYQIYDNSDRADHVYQEYTPGEQCHQDQYDGRHHHDNEEYYQDEGPQYYEREGEGPSYYYEGEGRDYDDRDPQDIYDDEGYLYEDEINSQGIVEDGELPEYNRGQQQFLELEEDPYQGDDTYYEDVPFDNQRPYDDYVDSHPRSYDEGEYHASQYAHEYEEDQYARRVPQMYHKNNVKQSRWDTTSEAQNTVGSKTLNTNLHGMDYIQEPYNSNYHGEAETAFDYSVSQYPDRCTQFPSQNYHNRREATYDGASTLASPVNDDDRSHDSMWKEGHLRNESLMDSPLSQDDFHNTHRPVSKFIKRVNNRVGNFTSKISYEKGEFRYDGSRNGSRDGSRNTSRNGSKTSSRNTSKKGTKKQKKEESATILDIMFNVGRDLITGVRTDRKSRSRRGRRKQDPAAKIVDGFVSWRA
jgi:hypothetical protein